MVTDRLELAARIAALEAELLEQARIVGAGGERELALMAKVERLEAEVARLIALPAEPDAAMVERVARAVDGTYDVKPDGDMTNLTDVATAACRAVLDQLREAGRG